MEPFIRLEFTPTWRTYLLFTQHAGRHPVRFLRPFAYFGLICFAFVPALPFEGNPSVLEKYRQCAAALFLPGIVFVLLPLSIYFSAKKRWAAAAELREHRIYEFSDAGILVSGGTFNGATAWTNIIRAETAGTMILLYTGQRLAHLIPLDAFVHPQQAEAFKWLLRQKVRDCTKLR